MKVKIFIMFLVVAFLTASVSVAAPAIASYVDSIPLSAARPILDEAAPFSELKIREVYPTVFFVNDSDNLSQVVILRIENSSATKRLGYIEAISTDASKSVGRKIVLQPGLNDVSFFGSLNLR